MTEEAAKRALQAMKVAVQESQLTLNEIRVVVALERAVARITETDTLLKHLVFKGGFVLMKNFESPRFTRDVDALALGISKEKTKLLVCKALQTGTDDGLWFGDIKIRGAIGSWWRIVDSMARLPRRIYRS